MTSRDGDSQFCTPTIEIHSQTSNFSTNNSLVSLFSFCRSLMLLIRLFLIIFFSSFSCNNLVSHLIGLLVMCGVRIESEEGTSDSVSNASNHIGPKQPPPRTATATALALSPSKQQQQQSNRFQPIVKTGSMPILPSPPKMSPLAVKLPSPTPMVSVVTQARALWDFVYEQPGDLPFTKDSIITITSREGDWWTGTFQGNSGIFPASYVELIPNDPQPSPNRSEVFVERSYLSLSLSLRYCLTPL